MKMIFHRLCILFFLTGLVACQQLPNNVTNYDNPASDIINSSLATAYPIPSAELKKYTPIMATGTAFKLFTPTATNTQTPIPRATDLQFTVCSPLAGETITSLYEIITNPFGYPPMGREDLHHGVDFAYYRRGNRISIEGEIIQSILPGIVSSSIIDRLPYGNMVIIETPQTMLSQIFIDRFGILEGESLYTLYAHMGQSPLVGLGDIVTCGQELGTVGKSGYDIVNPHLHLETQIGPSGTRFNGMVFYDTSALIEEMENYKRWRTSGDFKNIDPIVVLQELSKVINLPNTTLPP